MNVEIRPATAEEMGDMGILGGYVYGGSFGDGPDNTVATANLPEWTLCAFIDGQMASMFTNIPFTMRAQGNPMRLAGVSTIGTQPEFRRRGLVRRIHTEAFARMRDAGQPMAALWASQAAIYQRYGYAIASMQRHYTVDTADIGFFDGNDGSYDVRRVGADDAYDVAKKLYIEFIDDRMCYLHRAKALWSQNAFEETEADGPIWTAVAYDDAGTPRGYVIYTLRAGKVTHRARAQEIRIRDLVWLDQEAYRSIWSFIKSHDLVGRVFWHAAPVDDPAYELFVEPRMLHTEDAEGTWFRLVDIPAALAGRGYHHEGSLDITIDGDDIADWNNGHFRLDVSPDGAEVHPIDQPRDGITLAPKALTSLFTGFRTARQMRAWGFVDGSHDAINRATQLFETLHAPHCPDHF